MRRPVVLADKFYFRLVDPAIDRAKLNNRRHAGLSFRSDHIMLNGRTSPSIFLYVILGNLASVVASLVRVRPWPTATSDRILSLPTCWVWISTLRPTSASRATRYS